MLDYKVDRGRGPCARKKSPTLVCANCAARARTFAPGTLTGSAPCAACMVMQCEYPERSPVGADTYTSHIFESARALTES